MRLSVVVPAYNEAENVGPAIQGLQAVLRSRSIDYQLIAVNDNSEDETESVIRRFMSEDPHIEIVNRSPPNGFGRAIRSGLKKVNGEAVIIFMADQSDDPHDVLKYYEKLEEGYDCVYGSRFVTGGSAVGYPRLKLFCNRLVNRGLQLMFWSRHNDLTNAFKAYRTYVIRDCEPYRACHFNITIEMSLSALVRQYRIAEVPINWSGRNSGGSNLNIREMGRRYLSTLLTIFVEKTLISDDLLADHPTAAEKVSEAVASVKTRTTSANARPR